MGSSRAPAFARVTKSAQELHHSIDITEWNYASDRIPKYLEGASTKAKVVDEHSFPELLPRVFDRAGFKLALPTLDMRRDITIKDTKALS